MEKEDPPAIRLEEPVSALRRRGKAGYKPNKKLRSIEKLGYALKETISRGQFSKVKKGKNKANEDVVVKIINKADTPDDYMRKFLKREIGILQDLKHPFIIELLEVIESTTAVYMVFDAAEQGDVLEYIRSENRLHEAEARRLFKQLLDVVSHLHENLIVHRDIKCENMLLDNEYNLKLADFGFSRHATKDEALRTHCGSFVYAAPELIDGDSYRGDKADIWSMGVCLYTMLVGQHPFHDEDVIIMRDDMEVKVRFPRDIPRDVRALVRSMLNVNPKSRPRLSTIRKHPWMSRTIEVGRHDWSPAVSLQSVASRSIAGDKLTPGTEHGLTCSQKTEEKPSVLVSDVLRSVAIKHSTGESRVSLLDVTSPLDNLGELSLQLGVTGPVAKKIGLEMRAVPEFNASDILRRAIDQYRNKGMSHGKARWKAAFATVKVKNTVVRRLKMHSRGRGKGSGSVSMINLPVERVMGSVIHLREEQVDHDKKVMHYSSAGKAASRCGAEKRKTVEKKRRQSVVAEKQTLKQIDGMEEDEREHLNDWRSKCAVVATHEDDDVMYIDEIL